MRRPNSQNKKGYDKKINQKAYLISKYGLDNVEALINHLASEFNNHTISSTSNQNLKKSQRLKDQLLFLETECQTYFSNEKAVIIKDLVYFFVILQDASLVKDKKQLLRQFEIQKKIEVQNLQRDIQVICKDLQQQHNNQIQQYGSKFQKDLEKVVSRKSQAMISLNYQIQQLSRREQYQQAERLRQMLDKEQLRHRQKKQREWKYKKENEIKQIKNRQFVQRQSLLKRLRKVYSELVEQNKREEQILRKRIAISYKKINDRLKCGFYDNMIHKAIALRSNREGKSQFNSHQASIQVELKQYQNETKPSTSQNTGRYGIP